MTDPVGQVTTATAYQGGAAYTTQAAGFNAFGEPTGEPTGETITIPAAEGTLLGTSYTYGANAGLASST
jgi:hypothetical protein